MKENVNLIYASPMWLISNAIRYSKDNHDKSDSAIYCGNCHIVLSESSLKDRKCNLCDFEVESRGYTDAIFDIGEKDIDLIKRISFNLNHDSTLEHSLLVFAVKMSTKALLEESRHRQSVSQCVTSSRYTLNKVEIGFEDTGDTDIDYYNQIHVDNIKKMIEEGKTNDLTAMMLPQSFYYKLQLSFNLRSLVHFLRLRLAGAAHKTIRLIAVQLLESLPKEYQDLLLHDPDINEKYHGKWNQALREPREER